MSVILIFLDGIGLGDDDPAINPFAVMETPTLHSLSNGQRWLRNTPRLESERAIFLPTDTVLGIEARRPQSGSGQATILTGRNIPQEIGEHWGPKPNEPTRKILDYDNIFIRLKNAGRDAALVTPYPPGLHQAIARGKRLPSSIQYSVLAAGFPLYTEREYYEGNAVSPDWTGEGWTQNLGYPDAPTYTPYEAGTLLASLGKQHDFTMFSTWITDEIGHRGPFEAGVEFMQKTDAVLRGLLDHWSDDDGLVVITSDHGNMEVQGDRKHTKNLIPTIAIGGGRHTFAEGFRSLQDITPGILRVLGIDFNPIQQQETPS